MRARAVPLPGGLLRCIKVSFDDNSTEKRQLAGATPGAGIAPARSGDQEPTMQVTVHLYVFEGFADWEPAFALAGIRNPDFQREPGRFDVKTVASRSRGTLRTMGGIAVQPDMTL